MSFNSTSSLLIALVLFSSSLKAQIISLESKETVGGQPKNKITLGGYVKLVAAYDYLGLPNGSSFNMYEIPTTNDVENSSLNFNAWQSRIKIGNTFITNKEEKIEAYIEGDFHGDDGGQFRLRHAYVSFKNWTIGHTNSVFTNNDVWVNISDFDGPPVGTWVRQPQIKYTFDLSKNNQINVSIEDPVVDFRNRVPLAMGITPSKAAIPDMLFNYRHQFAGGNFQFSGVARVLKYKVAGVKDNSLGYGMNFSGTFSINKKDLFVYQGLAGKGIERYLVGLGGYGLDAIYYKNNLEVLPVYGGYMGYQHYWGSKLNSSLLYGYQKVENDFEPILSNVFSGNYYSANLFYEPLEHINLGLEFIYGDNTDYLDNKGRNHRFYFTMEYSF